MRVAKSDHDIEQWMCKAQTQRTHSFFRFFIFLIPLLHQSIYIYFCGFFAACLTTGFASNFVRKTQDLCFFNSFIVFLDESFDWLFDKAKLKLAENWIFIFSCVLRTREKSPNTKGCFKLPIQRKKKYFITISIFWKTFFTLRNRTKFNMRDDISQFLEQ